MTEVVPIHAGVAQRERPVSIQADAGSAPAPRSYPTDFAGAAILAAVAEEREKIRKVLTRVRLMLIVGRRAGHELRKERMRLARELIRHYERSLAR